MSIEAMQWARGLKVGRSSYKAVLIALADIHHFNNGTCFASEKDLVRFTEQNWKTIRKGLDFLADVGLISIEKRTGQAPHYRLHIGEKPSKIEASKSGNIGNLCRGTSSEHGRGRTFPTASSFGASSLSEIGGGKDAIAPSKKEQSPPQNVPGPTPNLEDKQVNNVNRSGERVSPGDNFSARDFQCAEWMLEKILVVAPRTKKPNLEKWADTIRLMRERDGLTHQEIAIVFKWANEHRAFWAANILSPGKLREQFASLDAQMRRSPSQQQSQERKRFAI